MKTRTLELLVFFTSATVLAFLYGYGSRLFGWFPHSHLDRAVAQTASFMAGPRYLGPLIHANAGVRISRQADVAAGLTLIATHDEAWGWQPGLKLIDVDGRILHQWTINTADVFGSTSGTYGVKANDRNVHGAYLFPDGDVLVAIEYTGLARLDACGSIKWSLANQAHHSVVRADDGTFWAPITTSARVPTSERHPDGYPGLDRPVNHDMLLHFTEDGVPIDTLSVLDAIFDNGLVRYLARARVPAPYPTDLTHVNDVEPLPAALAGEYPLFDAGDLLVSVRTASLIFVLDPNTGIIKWYESDPFVEQHDPDFIGDGWIGVFDNARDETARGTLLGGSRVVAVQPHSDSLKVLFPSPDSDHFYTSFLGKWQLLDNGNLLLTEGRAGRLLEAAPDGSTVWQWIEAPYGENAYAVEVTEGTRYPLRMEDVGNWPCSALEVAEHD